MDFPEGGRRTLELCLASWPYGPAWGDIEMPLEVTQVASGQEVTVATQRTSEHSSISHPILLLFSEGRKLSLPGHIGPGPCPCHRLLEYF